MRGGQWLNVAALATWLICAVPQIVLILQGQFTGWPAILWMAAYALYGLALTLFLGLGGIRLRLGYYAPPALAAILMVWLSLSSCCPSCPGTARTRPLPCSSSSPLVFRT